MTPGLDAIRDCLDGSLPGVMATCAPGGTPNVAYLSQVEYIDPRHLALSFQFFNKTRQNILANLQARLLLMHPQSSAMYRLTLRYLRTESAGPLFERMRAKLAGIASHTGMSGVFQLKGSDVYRVDAIEPVPGLPAPAPLPRRNLLEATRAVALRVADAVDLDAALEALLAGLRQDFDIHHAMVLLLGVDIARAEQDGEQRHRRRHTEGQPDFIDPFEAAAAELGRPGHGLDRGRHRLQLQRDIGRDADHRDHRHQHSEPVRFAEPR